MSVRASSLALQSLLNRGKRRRDEQQQFTAVTTQTASPRSGSIFPVLAVAGPSAEISVAGSSAAVSATSTSPLNPNAPEFRPLFSTCKQASLPPPVSDSQLNPRAPSFQPSADVLQHAALPLQSDHPSTSSPLLAYYFNGAVDLPPGFEICDDGARNELVPGVVPGAVPGATSGTDSVHVLRCIDCQVKVHHWKVNLAILQALPDFSTSTMANTMACHLLGKKHTKAMRRKRDEMQQQEANAAAAKAAEKTDAAAPKAEAAKVDPGAQAQTSGRCGKLLQPPEPCLEHFIRLRDVSHVKNAMRCLCCQVTLPSANLHGHAAGKSHVRLAALMTDEELRSRRRVAMEAEEARRTAGEQGVEAGVDGSEGNHKKRRREGRKHSQAASGGTHEVPKLTPQADTLRVDEPLPPRPPPLDGTSPADPPPPPPPLDDAPRPLLAPPAHIFEELVRWQREDDREDDQPPSPPPPPPPEGC